MKHPDTHLDRDARDRHALALEHVSPRVRARLREARRAATTSAPSRSRFGWLLAGGTAAAVFAFVLTSQLQPMTPEATPAPRMADAAPVVPPALEPLERASQRAEIDSEIDGMLAALDENPDLYLWLAANDDALPPPSEY